MSAAYCKNLASAVTVLSTFVSADDNNNEKDNYDDDKQQHDVTMTYFSSCL
jgi:hypothetical protein